MLLLFHLASCIIRFTKFVWYPSVFCFPADALDLLPRRTSAGSPTSRSSRVDLLLNQSHFLLAPLIQPSAEMLIAPILKGALACERSVPGLNAPSDHPGYLRFLRRPHVGIAAAPRKLGKCTRASETCTIRAAEAPSSRMLYLCTPSRKCHN